MTFCPPSTRASGDDVGTSDGPTDATIRPGREGSMAAREICRIVLSSVPA
jgi:hypothetical protein